MCYNCHSEKPTPQTGFGYILFIESRTLCRSTVCKAQSFEFAKTYAVHIIAIRFNGVLRKSQSNWVKLRWRVDVNLITAYNACTSRYDHRSGLSPDWFSQLWTSDFNARVRCDSECLPTMDLTKWKTGASWTIAYSSTTVTDVNDRYVRL